MRLESSHRDVHRAVQLSGEISTCCVRARVIARVDHDRERDFRESSIGEKTRQMERAGGDSQTGEIGDRI